MQIKKRELIPAPSPDSAIFMTRTVYVAPQGQALHQEYADLTASDTFGNFYCRQSEDNGYTWSEAKQISQPVRIQEGMLRRGEFALLLDTPRDRLIRFYNRSIYPGMDHHTIDVAKTYKLWFEISEDGGKSFSPEQQLIVKDHNEVAWAPDVHYGKNSCPISFSQPFVDDSGRIVLPAQWKPELPKDHTGPYPMQATCFIGETEETGRITWFASERAAVDSELSVRGIAEPTIAPLRDGTFFMVCRGSNVWQPEMAGRKWITTSLERGMRWEKPRPFGYDTGELFYSPATGSRLIRSSRNQKLYWIGNIVPKNPDGNHPRNPLCIAEVNEDKLALRKETVAQIDSRQDIDTPRVQLSNFHVYEDRLTGEFVLIMSRIFERSETSLCSPAYEYRIAIKE